MESPNIRNIGTGKATYSGVKIGALTREYLPKRRRLKGKKKCLYRIFKSLVLGF